MMTMHTSLFTESCSHEFIPRKQGQRAPCPALNALANHGYMSRDGNYLTISELVGALQKVYNLTFTLAFSLSLAAVLVCGNGFQLDLSDLCQHNIIEHNGSLAHEDCSRGQTVASSFPSDQLLHGLLAHAAHGHGLSLSDFAHARVDRESELASPLNGLRSQISTGESSLTWLVMKDNNNEVPTTFVEEWYGEERLPHGWAPPAKSVGIRSARGVATMIAKQMRWSLLGRS